jgi:hypothetical protein
MRLNGWQRIGIVASAALVALVAATSFAEATCGDLGGPGYRGPNGKCVGWEALGRVCGSPPTTRCTPEGVAPDADDAGEKGQKIQEQKNRQHDKVIRKGRDASQ